MGRKPTISKKKMLKAIQGTGGVVSLIAKRLDVDWHTAKKYLEKDEIKQAYEAECDTVADLAETVIFEALNAHDVRTAQWYLERKAAKRGYNPALRIENEHDSAITLNFIDKEGSSFEKKTE